MPRTAAGVTSVGLVLGYHPTAYTHRSSFAHWIIRDTEGMSDLNAVPSS